MKDNFNLRKYLAEGWLKQESVDSLGQSHGSQAYGEDDDFTKQVYTLMRELDSRMDEYVGREDGDYEYDENDARVFRALKRAYEGLDELVHLELADY